MDDAEFRFKSRGVAIALVLTNLATAAGLVVVASVRDADVLSTVALVVAVLAFVVQLIVFVAQNSAASSQLSESMNVLAEMRSVLGRLDARTAGTENAITNMNERVLERLLDNAVGVARKEGISADSPEFLERVVENAAREGLRELPGRRWAEKDNSPASRRRDEEMLRTLQTWPAQEEIVAEAAELLSKLDSNDRWTFARFVNDELYFRPPDRTLRPGLPLAAEGLIEHNLIEPTEVSVEGGRQLVLYQVSPLGRRVGSVLVAAPPADVVLPQVVHEARRMMNESFTSTEVDSGPEQQPLDY